MGKLKEGFRSLSREEGFTLIENYYRSGLRPSDYCKAHGITDCQFYGWRKRYLAVHPEANHSPEPEKKFHPVQIESPAGIRLSGFEIHYPHGVRLVISSEQSIEIEKLYELIKLRV
jgi:transposase-like protein